MGRLYCDFREMEISVLDIALLPEAQGKGIAAIIFRALCKQAQMERKRVTLCVHPLNTRARAFYERLGFRYVGEEGPVLRMDWWDDTTTPARLIVNPGC